MIQYKVINATHDEFHRMADELIKEGWLPQVGVAIVREYLTTPLLTTSKLGYELRSSCEQAQLKLRSPLHSP